ncbi:lysis system i-spanin subunit Rz [Marinobacter sp.]|uniref:lysis system i-spanin subunit Rz n=1 Tax=Marinobacter sp. TaxID=50741 RepID=UPI003A8E5B71
MSPTGLIPPQYKLLAAGALVAVMMALSAASAWQWQANSYGRRVAEQAAEHQAFVRAVAEANSAVIRQQQETRLNLEAQLATIDQTSTEKLTHANAENNRLERLYAAADTERKRLRIEVKLARADLVVSAATGAGSVGDATTVELSAAAGQAVWDIRRAMIEDRAKLEYLQEWARSVSRQTPP